MIDRLLSYAGQRTEPLYDASFGPHKAASEMLYQAPNNPPQTLTVVYGYWHATDGQMRNVAKHLVNKDSDVLAYKLHDDILNNDPDLVRRSFEAVVERSSDKVNELEHRYDYTNLLGFSLGNVPLSMAAERIREFDEVTMVVPGTDLLTGLWHGIRTRRLKQQLVAAGATYEQLEEEWADLAPVAHIDALEDHEVKVVLSKGDEFIPYRFGKQLVEAMVEHGLNPDVQINERIGHALTILNYVRKI